ncbi:MAG: hypothetical protein M3Q07_28520 [Pseudobdellovibrionaceae bacterium]|nr:hypothetical protein [Pseudobdellovibrionaceae bacterium]
MKAPGTHISRGDLVEISGRRGFVCHLTASRCWVIHDGDKVSTAYSKWRLNCLTMKFHMHGKQMVKAFTPEHISLNTDWRHPMNNETTCRTCGHWKLTERHSCPPLFRCRKTGSKGPWKKVHSYDARAAAERFADRLEQNGKPSEHLIEVRAEGEDAVSVFDITFDLTVKYHVSRPGLAHAGTG